MKYTFVGDLEGKVARVEEALAKDGIAVFVGDITDARDPAITHSDYISCYALICEAIIKGKAKACFANHELSYIMPHKHACSWSHGQGLKRLMDDINPIILQHFKPYHLIRPDFLVTHAGLTNQIWTRYGLTLENLSFKLDKWWMDSESPAHWIGDSRGGNNPVGGIFWCDYKEDFQPVPQLNQVFGHTRVKGIETWVTTGEVGEKTNYAIDCLNSSKPEFLELDI